MGTGWLLCAIIVYITTQAQFMSLGNLKKAVLSAEQAHGPMVVVGGAALALYGLDREPEDIDAWCSTVSIHTVTEQVGNMAFDLTSDTALWGRAHMPDLAEQGSVEIEGMRVATPETMFILKADASREKDIADLELLATVVTPDRVAVRLQQIERFNTAKDMFFVCENVISEAVVAWPHITDYADMITRCGFEESLTRRLMESLAPAHQRHKLAAA